MIKGGMVRQELHFLLLCVFSYHRAKRVSSLLRNSSAAWRRFLWPCRSVIHCRGCLLLCKRSGSCNASGRGRHGRTRTPMLMPMAMLRCTVSLCVCAVCACMYVYVYVTSFCMMAVNRQSLRCISILARPRRAMLRTEF